MQNSKDIESFKVHLFLKILNALFLYLLFLTLFPRQGV